MACRREKHGGNTGSPKKQENQPRITNGYFGHGYLFKHRIKGMINMAPRIGYPWVSRKPSWSMANDLVGVADGIWLAAS